MKSTDTSKIGAFYDLHHEDWEQDKKEYVDYLDPIFRRNNVRTVLDCSCFNGLQAVGLAEKGYKVTATDAVPEMVERSRMNAVKYSVDVDFLDGGILGVPAQVHEKFDAVISCGNGLPYMVTDEELRQALSIMHSVLNQKGICIIDVWNYSALSVKKRRFIPVLLSEGSIVVQVRDFIDNRVDLSTLYFSKHDRTWDFHYDSMKMRAVTVDELQRIMLDVGFFNVSVKTDPLWVRVLARQEVPKMEDLATGVAGVVA